MRRRLGQRGQTSVEYILLVGVMIFISITFFKKVRDYMVRNPNSFINRYVRVYERDFGQNGQNGYKTFTLRR